jgi:beta-alanine--pyruvate transaminase
MDHSPNSLDAYWMPFTANRDFKTEPRLIVRSEGVYLWDHKGGKILDGSSSLFNVALGHGRPEIADAVHAQLLQNDYTAPFQLAHPGAFALARQVTALLPEGFDNVFFANSGSEAIDTALKISMAYNQARGEPGRIRFVSRERAYHGVNIGGVSLSGLVKNRDVFPLTMPYVALMRHTWLPENRFTPGRAPHGSELADDLQRIVDVYGAKTIAACFVEPVAGSTGCLVPPAGYLERLREICTRNGILLVFDEVITGFGRLGAPFAAQAFGITPDIITMAKALTNGAQPMGAVAVKREIYDTIINAAPEGAIEFFHGYTCSAHPAACAAALATLKIYEREQVFERAAAMVPYFLEKIFALKGMRGITDIRGFGLFAGIDIAPGTIPGMRGTGMQKRLFWNGLHVKFTGDSALIAPPLIADRSHVDEICAIFADTLQDMPDC